jgi:hypothetical protein
MFYRCIFTAAFKWKDRTMLSFLLKVLTIEMDLAKSERPSLKEEGAEIFS